MGDCYACGAELAVAEKIRRTDECPGCGRDMRCCRNCRHYDPKVNNQCREVVAEWVADKERANFCDYFELAARPAGGRSGGGKSPEDLAREKFKKLFGS